MDAYDPALRASRGSTPAVVTRLTLIDPDGRMRSVHGWQEPSIEPSKIFFQHAAERAQAHAAELPPITSTLNLSLNIPEKSVAPSSTPLKCSTKPLTIATSLAGVTFTSAGEQICHFSL